MGEHELSFDENRSFSTSGLYPFCIASMSKPSSTASGKILILTFGRRIGFIPKVKTL